MQLIHDNPVFFETKTTQPRGTFLANRAHPNYLFLHIIPGALHFLCGTRSCRLLPPFADSVCLLDILGLHFYSPPRAGEITPL